MTTFRDIQRYAFVIVIFILYTMSLRNVSFIKPLYSCRGGFQKRLLQAGGGMKEDANTFLLTLISIIAFTLMYSSLNTISMIFIFASIGMMYAITGNLLFSVALSLIIGSIIVSFTSTADYQYSESFEDKETKEAKENEEKKEEEVDDNEAFEFDHKASFLENYKSLTSEQVSGLNKDTLELMNTQKQLIETLQNMGPVLKDGKSVLDSFKSYFGDEAVMNKDMGEVLKKVKNMKL
jgi:hypothetical protein